MHDLASHAAATFAALAPGAPYFAVMGVHAGSPMMSAWHGSVASDLALPRLYDLDEVVEVFDGAGFEVSVARLQLQFVPVSGGRGGHEHRSGLMDWLDYYARRQGPAPVHPAVKAVTVYAGSSSTGMPLRAALPESGSMRSPDASTLTFVPAFAAATDMRVPG